ncbi:MAG: hypothetical protein E7H38_07765 [Varibaculum cambriense]|uniref:hypothetical protein n=1 Tax=Varibaculum cambriense TaxID=184870 RepID=UPI0029124CA3|nr:hypothetical protein [Varibaculum cambriense]MDU4028250.1 hypothetical protein [Varibaculum cambriense]
MSSIEQDLLAKAGAAHQRAEEAKKAADDAIAARNKVWREVADRGISAYAIAKAIGVSATTVQRVVHDRR